MPNTFPNTVPNTVPTKTPDTLAFALLSVCARTFDATMVSAPMVDD